MSFHDRVSEYYCHTVQLHEGFWRRPRNFEQWLTRTILELASFNYHTTPTRGDLEVSEELGIARSVISSLWQRFQDDCNVSRCYSTGHHRVTTLNEDRYLAVSAKTNRRSTASDLSRQLSSATDTTVSR
ncbi:transposable element Tcb1 transposase [Trichonephila clavipes]|nr:transposable element Tcb1 transposase [Trichonephila clavipes]